MLQVGVIGCGVIGPTHAAAVALDARAQLRWACDLDEDKARARIEAERYCSDYRRVLDDPACELIAVCTQHPAHAAVVTEALAAGKHVVCEKPLGVDPVEVARLVECAAVAESRGQRCAGIFQHRFQPQIRRLHQVLRAGDFGRVRTISMDFACTRDADYYASAGWRGTWAGEGGGVLINQAIHTLDLALWLGGAAPQRVSAVVSREWLDCIDVEDTADAQVDCADGVACSLRVRNSADGGWAMRIAIDCSVGRIVLGPGYHLIECEHPNQALLAELHAVDAVRPKDIELPGKACYGSHHALQYQDLISAISAERAPLVDFTDAAVANQVVLACYHSSAVGGPVDLPLREYRQPVLPLSGACAG
ncbi:MAG: Gfo/Idh/MocA family protein [Planctomycetota bacterium]